MKPLLAGFIIGTLLLVIPAQQASAATDGETVYRFAPITQTSRPLVYKNLRAGYLLYKQNCKSCHFRGNGKGATYFHESSKTMRSWNRVLFKQKVSCAKSGEWKKLNTEQLAQVNDYLYSKAYDAWDPNTALSCG